MSGAIFVAAVLAWPNADAGLTLVASLLITGALVFTAGSALSSAIYRKPLRPDFPVRAVAVRHRRRNGDRPYHRAAAARSSPPCTSSSSPAASLLLPFSGGSADRGARHASCTIADVIITPSTPLDLGVWLQLGVFSAVALGSGYIAARLRQAGAGTEQLAAELVKVASPGRRHSSRTYAAESSRSTPRADSSMRTRQRRNCSGFGSMITSAPG